MQIFKKMFSEPNRPTAARLLEVLAHFTGIRRQRHVGLDVLLHRKSRPRHMAEADWMCGLPIKYE